MTLSNPLARQPRREVILAQISELEQELRELKRNSRWSCPACQRKTRARDLEAVLVKYYDDYIWRSSHWELMCPKCGEVHRLQFAADREMLQWVEEHRTVLKSVEERKSNA